MVNPYLTRKVRPRTFVLFAIELKISKVPYQIISREDSVSSTVNKLIEILYLKLSRMLQNYSMTL